jgi:CO dehydrogenase/acetyl-CoA synthase delta subunit
MTEYGVARGYMESMTNCYASAKNFGLDACIEMFKTKVADFYDGVIPGTGSRGKKMEKDFDADLTTIRLVVGKSLLNEFKFNPKEVNKLCDFIDVAAAQVAERHKKDAKEIKAVWMARVAKFNEELPM